MPHHTRATHWLRHCLQSILLRLTPADLLRAALACRRWRHAATLALPRVKPAPPLLGYFFHPENPSKPPPSPSSDGPHHPAVFLPLSASPTSPLLSLDLTQGAARSLSIKDVHLGLVLLLPHSRPKSLLPRILAVDPASRRQVLIPPPPRDPDDRWRRDRSVIGVAVLARAHPSRLTFDAACLTIDGDRPRAWVASVRDGDCAGWRALPRAQGAVVDFDPWWFESRCVHAAGNVYWHVCNSSRVLQLDPRTLELSFMPVPAVLGDRFKKYRVGETPEDGRLCIASMLDDQSLQIWVRGGGDAKWSDRGWFLEREICMAKVLDTMPGLPKVQGQLESDALHLAQRHGLRSHREIVHQDMGIWALLVSSGDRQAGALGDEGWQGARAPYLCLHLGLAA